MQWEFFLRILYIVFQHKNHVECHIQINIKKLRPKSHFCWLVSMLGVPSQQLVWTWWLLSSSCCSENIYWKDNSSKRTVWITFLEENDFFLGINLSFGSILGLLNSSGFLTLNRNIFNWNLRFHRTLPTCRLWQASAHWWMPPLNRLDQSLCGR